MIPEARPADVEGDKPKRSKFKRYPIGFFHIDIAKAQTAEGKLFLFVGIDRTSKFAVTQLVGKADRKTAWEFLQHMLEAVPYQVHTVLTDNVLCWEDLAAQVSRSWGVRYPGCPDMVAQAVSAVKKRPLP